MTKNSSDAGGGLVPVARSVPAVADSTLAGVVDVEAQRAPAVVDVNVPAR